MAETKDLAGVLFRVAEQKTPHQPTYTGSCLIDRRRYLVTGWLHTIQQGEGNGEEYISLSFTPADEPTPAPSPDLPPAEDDDIPF